MIQVRPVCGNLDEAMDKVKEFESLNDYANYVCKEYNWMYRNGMNIELFTTEPYGYDERINWDTWIIMYEGRPMAYSNGELK